MYISLETSDFCLLLGGLLPLSDRVECIYIMKKISSQKDKNFRTLIIEKEVTSSFRKFHPLGILYLIPKAFW